MRHPRGTDSEPEHTARLVDILGLASSEEARVCADRDAMLAEAGALWPVAAIALTVVPAGLIAAAHWLGDVSLALKLALRGVPAGISGLLLLALLRGGWLRRAAPHHRIALVVLGSTVVTALMLLLSQAALDLPDPAHRIAGVVSAFSAIIIAVIALHPVRAATIAFALATAVTMTLIDGPTLSSGASATLTMMLALGTLRLGSGQYRRLADHHRATAADRLATRLVAEYEGHGPGWFWQTDRGGRITYLSDKVARELSALGAPPVGEALTSVFCVDSEVAETERTLSFHLTSRTSFSDYSVRAVAGQAIERWWSISGRPLLDELGRFQGFIGSGSDLTEKRRAEAEITRLALFDSLTGLANRQRMRLNLEQLLAQPGGGSLGLFLLDLDRFKQVNDTQGHQAGDELLKQVAGRLQKTVGEAGMVGRLGGDEFQVLIPREVNRERLAELADRIITALSRPYYIDDVMISIGCSIGVAIAPEHGREHETLVRNADLALYAAKGDGRGVHRFYRDALLEGAQKRKRLEDDLRHALKHDQMHLTYQPVVSTRDERIVGYEALLRWEHPQRGLISPTEFIPVAEECGLIEAIGEWVMRTACDEAAHWPEHVRVAVNVSPIQFANPALPGIVTSALAASGLAPQRLELEITEGVFLNEDAQSEQMFRMLKGIGVRLALDDFGTGYSSLGYLKKAPFDKIKIDQSFVRGAIMAGNRNAAIIKAIVTLADTLGMETTAEGVEQQDEIALIRELGCSHIQGYVYGKPARREVVRAQLAEAGGRALPVGFKTSRTPRYKMLRAARVTLGDESAEVRIRDISASGVMIDGVDLPEEAIGYEMTVELIEGQPVPSIIRWVDDGRAGLEFATPFDMELLVQQGRGAIRRLAA